MKKSLLVMAACIMTAAASAQISVKEVEKVQKNIPTLFDMKYFKVADNQQTPARTKSSGTYYKRPQGAYYGGFSLEGYGYYGSTINLAPWHTVVYENMIPGKAGIWHQYYWSGAQNMGDILVNPDAVVVDGDYTWSQDPSRLYYTPTLRLGKDSFCIGEENLYLSYPQYLSYNPHGRTLTDSVGMKNCADDHQVYYYNGQKYSNTAAWGALSDNMFGSGETDVQVDEQGTIKWFQCYQVEQVMDRPMTNLYVESVVASGSSFSRQPIAEGDTLKCYITNVVQETAKDGSIQLYAGDQIYETLCAVAEDTIGFSMDDADTRNGKTIYEGKILFSKKMVDEFGIEYNAPIVIDPADFDENGFALVIDGFDKKGIDFGIFGWHVNDDVDDITPGRFSVYNEELNAARTFTYNGLITMQVGLLSLYDAVEVLENGLNVLRISDDGQTCSTDGTVAGSDDDLGAAAVYTAQPWFDEELNEYYTIVDAPEWVSGVLVDESMHDGDSEGNYVGLEFVAVTCDPLPAGVTGRCAQIHIGGRGVVAETPIYVLQGDATLEQGVNNVQVAPNAKNVRIFNANGQEVTKATKGVLIQNGKKFVNK